MEASRKPTHQVIDLSASMQMGWTGASRWMQMLRVLSPRLIKMLMARRRPEPREVREMFEELGVTYIKLGQMIASAPSVFPPEYVKEFENCLDNTPPLAFSTVKGIVESELGQPLDDLYRNFDPEPLASASIAQVHCATLHSGESVVVKVQKPDVDQILSTDLNMLFVMMRLAEMLTPGLSRDVISGFVTEIYQYMIDECDFVKEADNLEGFIDYLAQTHNTRVVAPRPYRSLSSMKVLTMEKLDGVSITDFSALQSSAGDPTEVLVTAMNTWFGSITGCPFFHADLHSGNLLLLDDGRIGFIDFGMVGTIDQQVWQATFALFDGLNEQQPEKIAKAMLEVGMTSRDVDVVALEEDIRGMLNDLESIDDTAMQGSIEESITGLLGDLGKLAREHGLHFPYAFTLLFKQLLYFDRYIHQMAPDLQMFDDERVVIRH